VFLQVFVAGASIPYPVNYLINVSVILAFLIVILSIATYRFYKSREARARRRLLTGRQCLNLNMAGVRGRYPPKKIKFLIEQNERRRQREAEAAEREVVIARNEALDYGNTMLQEPELESGENGRSMDKPSANDRQQDRSHKVRLEEPHSPKLAQDIKEEAGSSSKTVLEEAKTEPMPPTFVLPTEQNVEGDLDASEGNIELAVPAVVLHSELSVGQSQNNATDENGDKHSLLPEIASATKSTQTSPRDSAELTTRRDNAEPELDDSSLEGSFDDSVMGD